MQATRRLRWALLLAALLPALQGCGAVSYTRAAVEDRQRVQRLHRDCPQPGPGGLCDRELVVVTPPPRQMDCRALGRPGCPEPVPPRDPGAAGPDPRAARSAATPAAVLALGSAHNSVALARVLLPMAYLANVVYHRHEVGQPSALRTQPSACLRQQPLSTHPLERQAAGNGGWARWHGEAGCAAEEGLFYDTYVRAPLPDAAAAAPWQVAIVFRGTENTGDQFGHDWTDNFMSNFGLSPRQYTLAIDHLATTMAALRTWKAAQQAAGRGVEIYAVGHSLGGGLAQQAAYLHSEIDAVFAFNTTSVTNWTQLALWDGGRHIRNHDPVVFRVEQQGEFLDYLRFVTTRASARMLGRTDIAFNFGDDGAVGGHSIAVLACHLAVRAAEAADQSPGPLGHSPAQAAALAQVSPIPDFVCSAATLAKICSTSRQNLPGLAARCPAGQPG